MTPLELAGYRKTLSTEAARLTPLLARERREMLRLDVTDLPGGPIPSTDDEPNAGQYEVEAGLVANESNLLAEVTAALRRIDAGTFGRCAACGKPVTRARLDAVPHAPHCIHCARVAQPVGG